MVRLENQETGESEVTVKRLYRERGHVRLQPSNDAFEPLIVNDARIEGRVVAVIRVLPS
ncbi:MAG: S24 family peptidase [Candidatus Dormiibacterota bacterium]